MTDEIVIDDLKDSEDIKKIIESIKKAKNN